MFQSVRSLLRAMVRIVCTTVVVVAWRLTPGRAPTHHPSLRTAAAADVRDGPADRVRRAGGNLCAVGPGHGLGVDQGHHRAQVNYRRRCRQEDSGNGWLDFRLCLFSPHPFRQSFKGGGKKPKSALFTFHQLVGVCPCQQLAHITTRDPFTFGRRPSSPWSLPPSPCTGGASPGPPRPQALHRNGTKK